MSRRIRQWIGAAAVVSACLTATACWAVKIHESRKIQCPAVDAAGQIIPGTTTTATFNSVANDANGVYHGTANSQVANASGKTRTFHGLTFGIPGVLKSTYTVKANGAAKVTISGIAN